MPAQLKGSKELNDRGGEKGRGISSEPLAGGVGVRRPLSYVRG